MALAADEPPAPEPTAAVAAAQSAAKESTPSTESEPAEPSAEPAGADSKSGDARAKESQSKSAKAVVPPAAEPAEDAKSPAEPASTTAKSTEPASTTAKSAEPASTTAKPAEPASTTATPADPASTTATPADPASTTAKSAESEPAAPADAETAEATESTPQADAAATDAADSAPTTAEELAPDLQPMAAEAAITPLAAGGAAPLCEPGYLYSVSSTGQLRQIYNGVVTTIGAAAAGVSSFNGLGIGIGGDKVLAYNRSGGNADVATIWVYSPSAGTWSSTGNSLNTGLGNSLVAGAINLDTGKYFFGGFTSDGSQFRLWRYDDPGFTYVGYIPTGSVSSNQNGDMAFSANGDLFVVRGSGDNVNIYSVTAASLASANGGQITAATSNQFSALNSVNGVSFGSDGKAYLGNGTSVYSYAMPNWSSATNVTGNLGGSSTDLASCATPPTITVRKNIVGRFQATDQFKLTLTEGSTELATATTTGTANGIQSAQIGPIPASRGVTLAFSEAMASGTASDYTTTYVCTGTGSTVSGTGTSGSVTMPTGSSPDVVCTFTNTPKGSDLTVAKDITASYDRDYDWAITKAASPAEARVQPGQNAAFDYTVKTTVTGPKHSNFRATGTITVTNPNHVPISATVSDDLSTAGTCTVANPTQSVPANGSRAFSYSCTFPNATTATKGTNTAKVTWTQPGTSGSASSAAVPFDFGAVTPNVTDATAVVTDTAVEFASTYPLPERTLDAVALLASGGSKTFTYTRNLGSDVLGGQCKTYDNTARVTPTHEAAKSADAAVTVCAGQDLKVTKNVVASLHRTYDWSLTKDVDATRLAIGADGEATFTYTVSAKPGAYADDRWEMSGSITVNNPNDWNVIGTVTDTPSFGNSMTCAVTGGVDAVLEPGDNTFDYSCTFTSAPDLTGKNTATVTWDAASAGSPTGTAVNEVVVTAPDWSKTPHNDVVTVVDDKTNPANPVTLGTATWNANGNPTVFTYDLVLSGPTAANNGCVAYTNEAVIAELPTKTDSETVEVCAPVGEVAKSVVSTTQNADFSWTVVYDVVVTNTSTQDALVYNLTDSFSFGTGITVVPGSPTVVSAPAGVTPDAGWDGAASPDIASSVSLPANAAGTATHTYRLSVQVNADGSVTGAELSCTPGSASGFRNTTALTYPNGSDNAEACASPAAPTVTKTGKTATQDPATGRWTVSYDVVVTNPSELQLAYRLTDAAASLPTGVSLVGGWSVTGPVKTPDGAGTNVPTTGWNGTSQTEIGTGTLPGHATHTYTVTGEVAVGEAATASALTCAPAGSGGIVNNAAVTNYVAGGSASACVPITVGAVTVAKSDGVVTQLADFSWQIDYTVTVGNTSGVTTTYTLTDAPDLGDGFTLVPGLSGWQGTAPAANTLILDNATHTYVYRVVATFDPDAEAPQLTCDPTDGGAFFNKATATYPGGSASDTGCGQPTSPTVNKTGKTAVQDAETGDWTVSYAIAVSNSSGQQVAYQLADSPAALPDGVSLVGAWTVTGPVKVPDGAGASTPTPDWDGTSQSQIATGTLPAGSTHIYTVTGTVTLGDVDLGDLTCAPGSSSGLVNSATVTNGTGSDDASACVPIVPGEVTIEKSDGVVSQLEDFSWQVDYTVEVKNTSGKTVVYTLDDAPDLGTGFTLVSAGWLSGPADKLIKDGETDSYVYRIVATFDTAAEHPQLTCDATDGGAFFNKAEVTFPGGSASDTGCGQPASPTVTKTGATASQNAAGDWIVSYQVAVANASAIPLAYDLSDTPAALPSGATMPAGWVVSGPVMAPAEAGSAVLNAAWDGDTETQLATGLLPAGATHTYTVSGTIVLALDVNPGDLQCTGGGGIVNGAAVTNGVDGDDSTACVPIIPGTAGVTKSDGSVTQLADGSWQVDYVVRVSNNTLSATRYTVTDTPELGEGFTLVSGEWLAPAPVADTLLPAGEFDEFTYRVIAVFDPEAEHPELTCDESAGGAFFNRATVSFPGGTATDTGCAVPASPRVEKTPVAPVQNAAGQWTLSYLVTVTNDSAIQLAYTLDDDAAALPSGITGGTWTATGPSESTGTGTLTPGWVGTGELATGVLPAGTSHTYTVTRTVDVAASVLDETLTCGQSPTSGGGLWNTAEVTNGVGGNDDDACITIDRPDASITKKVTDTHQLVSGQWQITYDVVVTNDSADLAVVYSLADTVTFGGDIDVDSATWTGPTSGTFTGNSASLVSNRTLVKGGTDTYTVTVLATVDAQAWAADATLQCSSGDDPAAGGFLNTALLTVNGVPKPAHDCSEPALPTITKVGTAAVQQSGDASTWLVSYLVTVTSAGLDTYYDLSDTPDFAPGIGLSDGTAQRTDIAGQPVLEITAGTVFANDVELVTGAIHTYRITWLADLDDDYDQEAAASCGAVPTAGHGFYNRATLTVGDVVQNGDACIPVAERVYPTVTKTATSTVQNADGTWTIEYRITAHLADDPATNPNHLGAEYDLADTLAFGGGITVVSATWTGPGPTSGSFSDGSATLATDRTIAAGATDIYTVTAVASITPAAVEEGTLTCLGGESPGAGGFLNTAVLHSGQQDTTAHACTEPASPTVTKTAQAATQNPTTGEWTLSYQVVVTNPSELQLAYTVDDDAAALPPGVTGGTWTATGPAESTGDGTLTAGWVGTGELATGVLPAQTSHTYTVTRTVRVAASVPDQTLTCGESPASGGGLWNTAQVTNGAGSDDDDDCITIDRPDVDIVKTVTDTRQLVNGQWQITYTVVATNQSAELAAVYSLADTLAFGGDIDVDSASWTGPTSGTFSGDSATFATDAVLAKDGVDTYTVTVLATVDAAAWAAEESTLRCVSEGSPAAGGFLNTALLTVNSVSKPADDCSEPSLPSIEKSPGGAVQDPVDASAWTVSYELVVDNSTGLATFYDLTDTPGFAVGVLLGQGTALRTDIPDQTPTPIEAGVVAEDVALPAGARHVYRITWAADLSDAYEPETGQSCTGTPGHGFYNGAELSVGNVDVDDDACVPIPAPVAPSVAKTATSTAQGADGNWTITYRIDVTLPANQANQSAEYSLGDTLDFGGGITVVSASWTGQSSGTFVGSHAQLADHATIQPGTTHSYTVTAVASITQAAVDDHTLTCRSDESGPQAGGFLNTTVLTSLGGDDDAYACTEPASPTVTKTAQAAVQDAVTGEWTLSYTVVVKNPSTIQLGYTLDDTAAALPSGVTGGVWTATGPVEDSGGATLTSGWSGSGQLATGVLPAGASHSYLVSRTVKVAASVPDAALRCGATSAAGGGIWNTAVVGNGVANDSDDACIDIVRPDVTITKTVVDTFATADGTWQIVYDVVVANTSSTVAAVYSLTDTLVFGAGMVVESATWTGPNATAGLFTGVSATMATDANLAAGGAHTYTVTVSAAVPETAFEQNTHLCRVDTTAGGFLNTALATASGTDAAASACAQPIAPVVDEVEDEEGDTAVLAFTGATAAGAGAIGLGLLGIGILAVLIARRRSSEQSSGGR